MLVRNDPDWLPFYNFKTEAFQADNFLRVICKEPKLTHAEVEKDLCAESVIAQVTRITKSGVGFHGIETFLLQLVCVDFCGEPYPASFLAHVNQNAVAFLLDLPQRRVQLISTVASARSENVAGKALAVHTHERRFGLVDFAFDQREVMLAIEVRAIQVQIEIAVVSRHFHDLLQLYQLFANPAISDQTLDRTNMQAMFFVELHQFRQTCNRAIVVQNFAKHPRWLQTRHSCQVDSGLGVSCASQDAAVLCAQRKYMPGLAEVLRR